MVFLCARFKLIFFIVRTSWSALNLAPEEAPRMVTWSVRSWCLASRFVTSANTKSNRCGPYRSCMLWCCCVVLPSFFYKEKLPFQNKRSAFFQLLGWVPGEFWIMPSLTKNTLLLHLLGNCNWISGRCQRTFQISFREKFQQRSWRLRKGGFR